MNSEIPRSAVIIVKLLTPKFKKSLKGNIKDALVFCKMNPPAETEKEISVVEERIARISDRIASEKPVQSAGIDEVVRNVSSYGERYISKILSKQKDKASFTPDLFERLSAAKLNLAKVSISEKMMMIRDRRVAATGK